MPRSRVAVVSTTPETILEDYRRLLRLAGLEGALTASSPPVVLVDLPWERFQPAVGVPPWQLEGVLRALDEAAGGRPGPAVVVPASSSAAVHRALMRHRLDTVLTAHSLRAAQIPGASSHHVSAERRPVLENWFDGNIEVPQVSAGRNLLLLSTLKSHAVLGVGASIFAAAAEILDREAWARHPRFTTAVAEALAVSREIHPHHFAVVDATVCGVGAGPYRVRPRPHNLLVASSDPVAADAVGARLLGLDPRRLPLLADCHERGLGAIDLSEIEVVGERPPHLESPVSRKRWSPARPRPMGSSPAAQRRLRRVARNLLWYPWAGRRWRRLWRSTPWGLLFTAFSTEGGRR